MNKEIIYQIMNGYVNVSTESLSQEIMVQNEFADGKECDQLYNQVYKAKLRLENKLGECDNKDIELIISYMSSIAEILSMKMYDYGKVANQINL
ncbi:MAG: hypothetical protein K2N51_14110 [Lachnospiraceae bacterium]|nr:hypothetical protein [Lachnospiraceae bacterium]